MRTWSRRGLPQKSTQKKEKEFSLSFNSSFDPLISPDIAGASQECSFPLFSRGEKNKFINLKAFDRDHIFYPHEKNHSLIKPAIWKGSPVTHLIFSSLALSSFSRQRFVRCFFFFFSFQGCSLESFERTAFIAERHLSKSLVKVDREGYKEN